MHDRRRWLAQISAENPCERNVSVGVLQYFVGTASTGRVVPQARFELDDFTGIAARAVNEDGVGAGRAGRRPRAAALRRVRGRQ